MPGSGLAIKPSLQMNSQTSSPTIRLSIKAAAVLVATCGLVSCVTTPSGPASLAAYQRYDLPAHLPSDPNKVVVKVSTSLQRTYVMEGGRLLMVMPVSVGTASTPTPAGNFRIFRKVHKHRANSHGIAYSGNRAMRTFVWKTPSGWSFKGTPMPYWCEFKANYGFHTGWVKHQPCTHGCIRMHENLAPKFFRLVKEGTPVFIARTQPEDAKYGNIPLPPDAGPLPDYDWSMYLGDGYYTRHKSPVFGD